MSRKEARVVMMDLDQNLFPLTASFGASFCFHDSIIMSFNIDVGVKFMSEILRTANCCAHNGTRLPLPIWVGSLVQN